MRIIQTTHRLPKISFFKVPSSIYRFDTDTDLPISSLHMDEYLSLGCRYCKIEVVCRFLICFAVHHYEGKCLESRDLVGEVSTYRSVPVPARTPAFASFLHTHRFNLSL
jgi:hypothetical protein